jgi:hypothetical protein
MPRPDSPSPCSVEVRIVWSCTSTPYVIIVWSLIEHRDKSTFTDYYQLIHLLCFLLVTKLESSIQSVAFCVHVRRPCVIQNIVMNSECLWSKTRHQMASLQSCRLQGQRLRTAEPISARPVTCTAVSTSWYSSSYKVTSYMQNQLHSN